MSGLCRVQRSRSGHRLVSVNMVCSFLMVLNPLMVSTNFSSSMNCEEEEQLVTRRTWVPANIRGVSHHPAVVAWDVRVPRFVISREGFPIHHLADAAPQGAHTEDPKLTQRCTLRLAFNLQHILGKRHAWCPVSVQPHFFCPYVSFFFLPPSSWWSLWASRCWRSLSCPEQCQTTGESGWGGNSRVFVGVYVHHKTAYFHWNEEQHERGLTRTEVLGG